MGGRSTEGGGGGGEGEYRGEEEGTLRVFKTDAEIQNTFLTCVCSTALLQIGNRELKCSFHRCGRLLLKSADFVRTNQSFR